MKERRKKIVLDGESDVTSSDSSSDGSFATINSNTKAKRDRRQEFSIKAKHGYTMSKQESMDLHQHGTN